MPEPGAVLRVCCLNCKQETDAPHLFATKWRCRLCHKQAVIEHYRHEIEMEELRHGHEKRWHEQKMNELREKLQAVEGEP